MAEYLGALIYDSSINLAGLERDKNAAIAKLHSIGTEATKTFQNDIARALAKSVRPENFASDVAKAKALLGSIGTDTSKIFEKQLGRQAARQLLNPFVNELTTLKGQFKASLQEVFSLKNVAGGILSAGAITGAIHGLFDISKQVIAIGRDAKETRDKFDLVFSDMSAIVRRDANKIADSVGRARVDIEDFLAAFGTFLTPFGFKKSSVTELSEQLVKLAIDVASLQNKVDSDVIRDFQSALSGETEPVKKYGVIINEARIKQEGFNLGLIKAGEALTEQQKVYLRYTLLVKDLALAQNNAINTGDSLANQQKRLAANWKNLADQLSTTVIPILADATSVINELLQSIGKDIEFQQQQLDRISGSGAVQTTLLLTKAEQERLDQLGKQRDIIKAAIAQQELLEDVQRRQYDLTKKTGAELKAMLDANQGNANEIREELKRREEIARKVKETADELQRLAQIQTKLPDYLTKSRQNFEFGKIRGADNKLLSDGQFKKELEVLLNIKLTPALKLDTKKIIGVEKLTDDIRDALSEIGYPFKSFLIDLERTGVATEDELVQLADIFNRGLGDVFNALLEFVDKATDENGSILGTLLAGRNLFISAFSEAQSILESGFKLLFGDSNLHQRVEEEVRQANEAREREIQQSRDFINALRDVEAALKGPEVAAGTLIQTMNSLFNDIGDLSKLTDIQVKTILDALSGQNFKPATTLQELIDQLKFLSGTKPDLLPIIKVLESITDPNIKQALTLLFGQLPGLFDAIKAFGSDIGREFDSLIRNMNLKLDLLNVSDPLRKLDLLAKGIREKFGAIIPQTDDAIRDLITQGVAALEAGGQTLIDFLKSRDLEELTAEQFRDLLQLLNNLANEAKSKVAGITDAASESVISQVRQITFEQGNAVIDNLVTSRIILTNILDAERQMLELARRNIGLTGSGAVLPSTRDRFFFFNDGVISETSAAALSQLQRKMYNDALAAAGGKGLS